MKCYNCGNLGHSAKNCPKGIKCHKCKKYGHMSKDCPNNNSNSNDSNSIKCYTCGKTGHKMGECPNKKGQYCYLCGKSGHIKANCPDKDKKNKKEESKDEDRINVDDDNNLNCPICLQNSSDGRKFQVSKCGHIICKECCNSIFKSSNNSKCPICKKSVNKNDYVDIYI